MQGRRSNLRLAGVRCAGNTYGLASPQKQPALPRQLQQQFQATAAVAGGGWQTKEVYKPAHSRVHQTCQLQTRLGRYTTERMLGTTRKKGGGQIMHGRVAGQQQMQSSREGSSTWKTGGG
jgi:hypothetical protein